jgi:photosystem II stability/assembly factor-like uncharacterized protein
VPIALRFVSGITAQELPAEATGQIGIKATGDYDGGFIAATGPWVKSGTGADTVYTFQLDLHTEAINTLLGYGPAEDVPSMQAMLELEYEATGIRTSSNTVLATIFNDVVRGDEGTPTSMPTPEEWLLGSTAPVNAVAWTSRNSSRQWTSVASSADGTKLVACVSSGQIYTSTDSGVTWTARDSSRLWRGVVSSSDGSTLAAFVELGGQIYTSTDSGATWTARDSGRMWAGMAMSPDGTKLVACVSSGQIYTSTDSGVTWTARESSRQWGQVAISNDGTKLVACVTNGQIYTSADSGATWTARQTDRAWRGVACSSDGSKIVAIALSSKIYTSTDSGATWTARETIRDWGNVVCSSDMQKILAGAHTGLEGRLYLSVDAGETWQQVTAAPILSYRKIAFSSDWSKLVAAPLGANLYTVASPNLVTTSTPPFVRVAGGFLYIQEAGVWKKTALSAL